MSLNARLKASRFEPERSRVLREMCREFGRKISKFRIEIAVDEACEEWHIANAEGRIENEESRYGYIRRAAQDKLLNVLRRRDHEIAITDLRVDIKQTDDAEWVPGSNDGGEAARDAKRDVRWLLKKLPKDWRRVERYKIDGFTVPEIAELMGRTNKAVSRIVGKAEARMKELGIKYLGYPPPKQEPRQSK